MPFRKEFAVWFAVWRLLLPDISDKTLSHMSQKQPSHFEKVQSQELTLCTLHEILMQGMFPDWLAAETSGKMG